MIRKVTGIGLVSESKSNSDRRMVDITRDKPIKVAVRVVVPVRDHPKVNIDIYIFFLFRSDKTAPVGPV